MPVHSALLMIVWSLLIVATAAGMFTTLFWVLWKFLTGRPLLPPWPDRSGIVPWGGGTIILVVATWLVVNVSVTSLYLLVRSQARIQRASQPNPPIPARARKVEAVPRADPETPAPRFTFTEQMLLISLINGVLLLVVPAGIRVITGAGRKDLGLTSNDLGRDLKLGAIAFLAITPVVMTINALAQLVLNPNKHPLEKMLRAEMSPGLVVLAYLSAVVLAPAVEEILFRGVIQAWLRRLIVAKETPDLPSPLPDGASAVDLEWEDPAVSAERPRVWWLPRLPGLGSDRPPASANPYDAPLSEPFEGETAAPGRARMADLRYVPIVLTSALFAAVHFEQMPAPLAIFPLALVLGLLYERTESLVPSFLLHALFNGFNTTLLIGTILVGPDIKP